MVANISILPLKMFRIQNIKLADGHLLLLVLQLIHTDRLRQRYHGLLAWVPAIQAIINSDTGQSQFF
jgi:hypothetical protein